MVLYLLGALFVALSGFKFLFISDALDARYFLFEFLAYGVVFSMVLFFERLMRIRGKDSMKIQEELHQLQNAFNDRESQLLLKIMKLEEREQEELQYTDNKEKTVFRIMSGIDPAGTIENISNQFLASIAKRFELVNGIVYFYHTKAQNYQAKGFYAIDDPEAIKPFATGEGLCGQAVLDKKLLEVNDIPEDYFVPSSGLGEHLPVHLYFFPIMNGDQVIGLVELGSFKSIELSRIWTDINNKLVDLLKNKLDIK